MALDRGEVLRKLYLYEAGPKSDQQTSIINADKNLTWTMFIWDPHFQKPASALSVFDSSCLGAWFSLVSLHLMIYIFFPDPYPKEGGAASLTRLSQSCGGALLLLIRFLLMPKLNLTHVLSSMMYESFGPETFLTAVRKTTLQSELPSLLSSTFFLRFPHEPTAGICYTDLLLCPGSFSKIYLSSTFTAPAVLMGKPRSPGN